MVVIPNLMGFATFSPRLDAYGNSVRGVGFCRQLVDQFSVHVYDNLSGGRSGCKRDPRVSRRERKQADLGDLRWGLSHGDRSALRVRDLILRCMVDISLADGELEGDELATMAQIHAELIGEPPAEGSLEALAAARGGGSGSTTDDLAERPSGATPADQALRAGPFELLLAELREEASRIDDQARQIILDTAFRVACADGMIEDEEEEKLRQVATALGISEGVLDLEINAFRQSRQALTA